MITIYKSELTILQFANLTGFSELTHFSTTRIGGCSEGNYFSLNLGFNSGDSPGNVKANRLILCKAFEISPDLLVLPDQTHSSTVKTITSDYFSAGTDERKRFLNETDAIITNLHGVCIAVKTADCIPILLFDQKRKVVAAVHAGWRGTAQSIVLKTINKMVEDFGSETSDFFAGIGPSISQAFYEVGEEVWSQFTSEFYHETNPEKADRRLLDLWSANLDQLIAAGIPENQIELARICTWSDHDQFFSARRDGAKTGRMATGIMIR
jgi:polyphenol oxidase